VATNRADATTDRLVLAVALPVAEGVKLWQEIQRDSSLSCLPMAMFTAGGAEMAETLGRLRETAAQLNQNGSPDSAAKVKKLLADLRSPEVPDQVIEAGDLVIDPFSFSVSRAGKRFKLGTLEFRLLYYLASRPNRFFTRRHLFAAVWPEAPARGYSRVLDVHIYRLRQAIEADPSRPVYLKSQRGIGYSFARPSEMKAP
jgi:two-component system, OmpR family, response regulator VicR